MIKKILYITVVLVIVIACKSKRYLYDTPIPSVVFEGALESNEAYVLFTRNFYQDKIKVIQRDSTLLDDYITSVYGKAKVVQIDKNYDVSVYINNKKNPLVFSAEQMKNYHHIYVYQNNNRFYVHFTDKTKQLYGDNTFFSSHTIKEMNCKITAIDSSSGYYLIKIKEKGFFKNNKLKSIIVPKIDTLITDLPKIKIGDNYKIMLNDLYYNDTRNAMKINGRDTLYYDNKELLIWDKKTDIKFYTTQDLIGLYYTK